jgi:hypothetical protein
VCSIAFSQEKNSNSTLSILSEVLQKDSYSVNTYNEKLSLQIGTGISVGTKPYSDGYGLLGNNKLFNGVNINCFTLGVTYNSSKFISYKMDFSFDQFTNGAGANSKPFEAVQYRTAVQGQINMSRLANLKKEDSQFNLLVHGGIQIARLVPVPGSYNNNMTLSKGDNIAGVIIGVTPTLRIIKNLNLFVDLSSINNFGQNLTWNGLGSKVSNNTLGHMYSINCGLSFGLENR